MREVLRFNIKEVGVRVHWAKELRAFQWFMFCELRISTVQQLCQFIVWTLNRLVIILVTSDSYSLANDALVFPIPENMIVAIQVTLD